MKNPLAMVQAIVTQSLRHASDKKEASELASAHIMALTRAQDALPSSNWIAPDIRKIVAAAIAPHDDEDRFRLK